jgi:hypothetical protein
MTASGRSNNPESGFGSQFSSGWTLLRKGVGELSYACMMAPYYWAWIRKERIKRRLRLGSFIVLLLSVSLLVVEFLAEYLGAERLSHWLKLAPVAEGGKIALVLAAATFILFHYRSEIKKPEYEFRFVISLLTLMSKQREGVDVDSLQIFHALFANAGVVNISAYTHKENRLLIHSKYTEEPTSKFLDELPIDRSVAGRALSDGAARYSPRLFLPNRMLGRKWCVYMPHALLFKFEEKGEDGNASFYELSGVPRVERDVFIGDKTIQFCSLLSVPIKLGNADDGCIGVLNFEFLPPSTLDTVDIAMASVYAGWFGREVLATQPITPYVVSKT